MRRNAVKWSAGCGLVLILGIVILLVSDTGKSIRSLIHSGIAAQALDQSQSTYSADRESNLKSIFKAMKFYNESEGKLPAANEWMDAITKYIHENDLPADQAAKKLIRPDLASKPDQYGYALNGAVAGLDLESIKDKKTILVFECAATDKNAHGKPEAGRLGVSADGNIVKI